MCPDWIGVGHEDEEASPSVEQGWTDGVGLAGERGHPRLPAPGAGLSEAAQRRLLARCEKVVADNLGGFFAVGKALMAIRDWRLYALAGYESFEDYCRERWDFGRARACQLIHASEVVDRVYNCKQIEVLPRNEAQVRPLITLDPEEQVQAWQQAVKAAPGGRITAEHVAEQAEQYFQAAESRAKFNPVNENMDWAKWSWNPVTGCRRCCTYCYARRMSPAIGRVPLLSPATVARFLLSSS